MLGAFFAIFLKRIQNNTFYKEDNDHADTHNDSNQYLMDIFN